MSDISFCEIISVRGIDIEVSGICYPGCKGLKDSIGVPETPDEAEEVEFESIRAQGVEITDLVMPELYHEILAALVKKRRD